MFKNKFLKYLSNFLIAIALAKALDPYKIYAMTQDHLLLSNKNQKKINTEIVDLKWGEITVKFTDGKTYNYKDCKISPNLIKAWDWSITGTRHNTGIQISDIKEIMDAADYIILTTGILKKLKIMPETLEYIKKQNKFVYVLDTKAAVLFFNELSKDGKKVAGIFHTTC